MKRTERTPTLAPFCAVGLLGSAALCAVVGYGLPRLIWMLALWFLVFFAGALLLFALTLFVISLLLRDPDAYSPFCAAMVKYAGGLTSALFRIRIHVSGIDRLPAGTRWLLVCNHRSNHDPLVTLWVLRNHKFAFILKPSLASALMVGPFVRKAGCLPIDRENDREALKTILTAAKRIKAGELSYCIYPEGTRSGSTELLPFRNGAFKLGQRAQSPIVVAAIRGTERVSRNFPWRATDVYMDFCADYDPETCKKLSTIELGDRSRMYIEAACGKKA